MKKIIFSLCILLLCQYAISQTPYPCTLSFNVINNSNGGQGCPSTHPDDPNYDREGVVMIRFTNAIGTSINPPKIISIQRMIDGELQPAVDMKYVVKSVASDRKSVEYCYYTATNGNLFNGSGALYVFTIQYDGLAPQVCDPVQEGSPTLPVEFYSFMAEKTSRGILLKWETAFEENNTGFYVERRQGTGEWIVLSFIPSKADQGFSNTVLSYTYEDVAKFTGITQYRIKQVDLDGKFAYSDIRSVRTGDVQAGISIFPNPSHGALNIVFDDQAAVHDIQVVDVSGRVVKAATSVKGSIELAGLVRGQYLVMVTNNKSNETVSEKFIVQ